MQRLDPFVHRASFARDREIFVFANPRNISGVLSTTENFSFLR
jgi:hypothetical protein